MGNLFIYLIITEFILAGIFYAFNRQWWLAGYAVSAAIVNWCVISGAK